MKHSTVTVNSWNEWDPLKQVVVGSASKANWPEHDVVFRAQASTTKWTHSPLPAGPVPQWIVDEANEDLDGLAAILNTAGVEVFRPSEHDFVQSAGMYNYCPRDRVLIAGNTVVDAAMLFPCRDQEIMNLEFLVNHNIPYRTMPRELGCVFDAANVCRMNDHWLFLRSASGNDIAYRWLTEQFPDITIEMVDFYSGVHIDSTILPLREGTALVNASRVTTETLPRCIKKWEIIWVQDCVARDFYRYPYASKWIGMNVFSIDSKTVIVDQIQNELIKKLESCGFTVIPHQLRHSRTLGGGFHCVTLDLCRTY